MGPKGKLLFKNQIGTYLYIFCIIYNWVYIFHRVLSDPYSDVLCSEECQTRKLLVCCKMFAFFKAIFNICITCIFAINEMTLH